MVDPVTMRRTGFRLLFLAMAALVIFVRILPFRIGTAPVPAPELLTLTTFAWVIRRPEYAPVALIALVHLTADILFMRPLGLWTILVVLGCEYLRKHSNIPSELPFPVEWVMVTMTLATMIAAGMLVQAVLLVPQPSIGANALQLIVSAAAYPIVVVVTAFGLGVRPAGVAERDAERKRA
ncbi:rod shape-determining protein MreD [Palleronia sediminis]|uniref:Rod shape-determining protein MreD n=1 Tax=Palleronia sediminis TaxID=2547833 RepID=A0A4R6A5F8_9RHOB|nr:rod shape-determining protein MreD [Palleronia sediminis]TDL75993.1 rod shape-determining protein MreD [Palleronia sediminis]